MLFMAMMHMVVRDNGAHFVHDDSDSCLLHAKGAHVVHGNDAHVRGNDSCVAHGNDTMC